MKFVHIADLHLGASPEEERLGKDVRGREIWDTLARVLAFCREEGVDLLLIAGDLFHRQPLLGQVRELDQLFASLAGTRVVFIAGNHDWVKPDSRYRSFSWSPNVYPLLGDALEAVYFEDLGTAVYGFSYHRRDIPEPLYDGLKAPRRYPHEILLAHGGDAAHIPIRKESLAASGFDYVALGHIHLPQQVVPGRAFYAGALEPIDLGDTGAHGFILGEVTERGTKAEFVPFACREYIHLTLQVDGDTTNRSLLDQLKKEIDFRGREHFYKVVLEGSRDPETEFYPQELAGAGLVLEVLDHTRPAYDLEALERENRENLLGKFIGRFREARPGSLEAEALYEGVQALLGEKIG